MADISLIIDVQDKGVVQAVKNTKSLERNVKLLSTAFKSGDLSKRQYYKGIEQLSASTKKSEAELRKYATQVRRVEAEEKKAKEAVKQYALARKQANEENLRFNAEQRKAAATARSTADANRRLRMEFREGYAAQVQLRAAQMRLSQAFRQGIIDSGQYRDQLQNLEASQRALGNAAQVGGRKVNSYGMLTQQAGYQVGDFLVQVQGGTNPMVAFGQQATQMIGAFNLMPQAALAASVGIGVLRVSVMTLIASLGIIIPLLTAIGAYFMRKNAAAKEASKGVDQLSSSIESLDNQLQDWLQTKKASEIGITKDELISRDSLEEAERNLAAATEELRKFKEAREAIANAPTVEGAAINFLTGMFQDPEGEMQELLSAFEQAQERVNTLRQMEAEGRAKAFENERIQLEEQLSLAKEIQEFGANSAQVRELELEQRIASYNRVVAEQVKSNELTEEQGQAAMALNEEVARTEFLISASKDVAVDLASALGESATNMLRMAGINITSGVDTAAVAAAELAKGMFESVEAALAMINIANGMKQQSGPRREGPKTLINSSSSVSGSLGESYRRSVKIGEFAPSGGSGGGGAKEPEESALEKLQKELGLMEELRGKSEEYLFVRDKLGDSYETVGKEAIASLEAQYAAIQQVKEADQERAALAESIATTMGDGLTSIVDGTKSVKDAFKDMARSILKQLWEVYVMQQIVGQAGEGGGSGSGLAGLVGKIFGASQADGGAWQGGSQIKAYADGGVVNGPTVFPMANGIGLMGEAGPEAIMPLKRGKNGKLGVQVEGGSQQPVVINQSFNFTANGDESVKRIIAQEAPRIANLTQQQIMDQRRRGGAMKSTFG